MIPITSLQIFSNPQTILFLTLPLSIPSQGLFINLS